MLAFSCVLERPKLGFHGCTASALPLRIFPDHSNFLLISHLSIYLTKFKLHFIHYSRVHVQVPQSTCGSQRATFRTWYLPSAVSSRGQAHVIRLSRYTLSVLVPSLCPTRCANVGWLVLLGFASVFLRHWFAVFFSRNLFE